MTPEQIDTLLLCAKVFTGAFIALVILKWNES